jgi:hypothetical protein
MAKAPDDDVFAPLIAHDYAALEIRLMDALRTDLIERARIPTGFLSSSPTGRTALSPLIKVDPDLDAAGAFYGLDRKLAMPELPKYGISLSSIQYAVGDYDLTIKAGEFIDPHFSMTFKADMVRFFDPPPRIPPRVGRRDWTADNPWPKGEE